MRLNLQLQAKKPINYFLKYSLALQHFCNGHKQKGCKLTEIHGIGGTGQTV